MPRRGISTICLLILGVLAAGTATALSAQNMDQGKAPMYIYVSQWAVPRAQWADMAKSQQADRAIADKLLADGTITAYGMGMNMIHQEGQPTHTTWMTASSEGNILKALEAYYAAPGLAAPVLAASKHWDYFLVSRMYNRRPGTHDGAYLSGAMWNVKPGEGMAFAAMLKSRVIPVLEKLMADGTVIGYSFDMEDYHTTSPGLMEVVIMTPDASGLDKIGKAFDDTFSKDTEIGPAMRTLVKWKSQRDFLLRVEHMSAK
jgi:hypothetical protein